MSENLATGLLAMLVGGGLALVGLAWLTDQSSDAGCDDPRMTCNTTTIGVSHDQD